MNQPVIIPAQPVDPRSQAEQAVASRLAAARVAAAQRKTEAQQLKDARLQNARRDASQRIANTTFRNIYFVFDNLIHRIGPSGATEIFIAQSPSREDQLALERYQQELEANRIRREELRQLVRNRKLELDRAQSDLRRAQREYRETERTLAENARQLESRIAQLRNTVADLQRELDRLNWTEAWKRPQLEAQRAAAQAAIGGVQPALAAIQQALVAAQGALRAAKSAVDRRAAELESSRRQLRSLPQPEPPKITQLNAAVADIAVDVESNLLFWARWADPFQVFRMDLQSNDVRAIHQREDPVTSVTLDRRPDRRQLYWIEGNRRIMRAPMDGNAGQPEEFLVITAPDKGGLWQLELDFVNNRVYWTNDISIWRADIDSDRADRNSLMVISPSESVFPIDVAVDGLNGWLYWIDQDVKALRRSDLDGKAIEDLYPIERPRKGIKVDPVANLLYWTDAAPQGRVIRRAPTMEPSLRLNGTDEYVELGDLAPGSGFAADFTIEMWVNAHDPQDVDCFLGLQSDAGEDALVIGQFVGGVAVNIRGQAHVEGPPLRGMHHLAIVVERQGDGSDVTVYRDGELLWQRTLSAVAGNVDGNSWIIGGYRLRSGQLDQFLSGAVRELRVWTHRRSIEQVRSLMHTRLEGHEPGLHGYWLADHRTGRVLPDLAGGPANPDAGGHFGLLKTTVDKPARHQVLQLDGEGLHVALPEQHFDLTHGFTVEAWARYDRFNNMSRIIDFGSGPHADNILLANIGTSGSLALDVYTDNNFSRVESPNVLRTNEWMHLAATISHDGRACLLVNGRVVQRDVQVHVPRSVPRTNCYLGRSNWEQDADLAGSLAEVRIWNRARTETEIRAAMHHRLSGSEQGLVRCWPLNDGNGLIARNLCSEGDHGMIESGGTKLAEQSKLIEQDIVVTRRREQKARSTARARSQLDEQRQRIAAQLEDLNRKHVAVRKAVSANDEQLGETKQQLVAARAEMEEIVARLKSGDSTEAELEKVRQQLSQRQRELEPFRQRMDELTKQRSALHLESSQLDDVSRTLDERLRRLNASSDGLEQRIQFQRPEPPVIHHASVRQHQEEVAAQAWQQDSVPVEAASLNPAAHTEIEDLFNVPGVDGFSLVEQADYLKARRKDAVVELQQAEEEGARQKQAAADDADRRRGAAETDREQQQQQAAAAKAAALGDARRRERLASQQKRFTELAAKQQIKAAGEEMEARIADANRQAGDRKADAVEEKDRLVGAATDKRDRAQGNLDDAQARRRGLR